MKRNNRGAGRYVLPIESLEGRVLASQAPWSPAMLDAEAHSGAVVAASEAGLLSAAPTTERASHAGAASTPKVNFDIATLIKMVKPLRHGLGANAPMVLWGWPQPTGDLRSYVDALAARGMVPQLPVGPDWNSANTIAFAQALEAANLPVYLVFTKQD